MTTEDELLAVARGALGESSRWVLTVQRDAGGFGVAAEHPASAGLVLATGTLDKDRAARLISTWMEQREFAVADAAPELVHSDAVFGVQALARGFCWPTVQVRGVAFLLFEVAALTADEAGWLSGLLLTTPRWWLRRRSSAPDLPISSDGVLCRGSDGRRSPAAGNLRWCPTA